MLRDCHDVKVIPTIELSIFFVRAGPQLHGLKMGRRTTGVVDSQSQQAECESRGRVSSCQAKIKLNRAWLTVAGPSCPSIPRLLYSHFLLSFLSSQSILFHSLVISMFGILRRISSSIYPRPDRPWSDDGASRPPLLLDHHGISFRVNSYVQCAHDRSQAEDE